MQKETIFYYRPIGFLHESIVTGISKLQYSIRKLCKGSETGIKLGSYLPVFTEIVVRHRFQYKAVLQVSHTLMLQNYPKLRRESLKTSVKLCVMSHAECFVATDDPVSTNRFNPQMSLTLNLR